MHTFEFAGFVGSDHFVATILLAALIRSSIALSVVGIVWAILRKRSSNATMHALFLLVPIQTVVAVAFAVWPVEIAFDVPVPDSFTVSNFESFTESMNEAENHDLDELDHTHDRVEITTTTATSQTLAEHRETTPSSESETHATSDLLASKMLAWKSMIPSRSWRSTLTSVWSIGCITLAFVCMYRQLRIAQWLRSTMTPACEEIVRMTEEMAVRMGMKRDLEIRETSVIATPAVVGIFKPILVVPIDFSSAFDENECRWALAHELAHIRRRDLWILAFERVTGILFFFCPALWVTQRITKYYRELACDDTAQSACGLSGGTCAETFLKLIIWSTRGVHRNSKITPELSLIQGFPAIRRRIMNMTDTNEMRRMPGLSTKTAIALTTAAILWALPLAPILVAETPLQEQAKEAISQNEKEPIADSESPSIGGVIVDENDEPIADATVNFLFWKRRSSEEDPQRTEPDTTDSKGKFRIRGIPSDTKLSVIQITHPDFSSKSIPFLNQEPNFESLKKGDATIRLDKGILVRGLVLDPEGKPLADTIVSLARKTYFTDSSIRVTNDSGEFSFGHIDKYGNSTVIVKKPGYGSILGKLDQAEQADGVMLLKMERARSLKGVVTDEQGNPLSDVHFDLKLAYSPNEYRETVKSDAVGKFEFVDLPESRDLKIHYSKPGFSESRQTIRPDQKEELRITLNKGLRANGTVKDKTTGATIENFEMTIMPLTDQLPYQANSRYSSDSGKSGFRGVIVSRNAFSLKFEYEGYRSFVTQGYSFDQSSINIEIELEPIRIDQQPQYRGKVVASDGSPVANTRIGVISDRDYPLIQNGAIYATQNGRQIPITDASGSFEFRNNEPFDKLLVLHDSGVAQISIEAIKDPNAIELKLEPYGQIAGKLLRNGKPDSQSSIALYYPRGGNRFLGSPRVIEPKPDGSFLIESVIPGVVHLDLRLAGVPENSSLMTMRKYQVESGKTMTFDRDLKVSDGPHRDVKGKIHFVDRPIPMNLSQSKFILHPPAGNPLRAVSGDALVNSPSRVKYRETPEGKAMQQAMDEFLLLDKSMTPDGEFLIKGMPAGEYELLIWAGNANTILGDVTRVIRIEPTKPGEPESPIDLGVLDIGNSRLVPESRKPEESAKPSGETKAKPGN
jgi:beta-lactamase regulating signal transducer with metallopeptidase domain